MADPSSRPPARFQPRRPAPRAWRPLLFLLGPVVWLVALLVIAFVLDRREAIEFALVVFAVSCLAALLALGWTRVGRDREEPEG